MDYCNRTTVTNSSKTRLLDKDNNETKNDLFEEVRCRKKAVSDGACYDCLSKEENNKKIHTIDGHKLYDKDGTRIWQTRVIHRRGEGPLPAWSQIKDGEWYNSMLKKGFRTESDMAPKKKEENVVAPVLANTGGKLNFLLSVDPTSRDSSQIKCDIQNAFEMNCVDSQSQLSNWGNGSFWGVITDKCVRLKSERSSVERDEEWVYYMQIM